MAIINDVGRTPPQAVAARVGDLEREVQKVDRSIAGFSNHLGDTSRPADGDYRSRLEVQRKTLLEQLRYWSEVRAQQLETSVAHAAGPTTIGKGDMVLYQGRWHQVIRVNAKSISVRSQAAGVGPTQFPTANSTITVRFLSDGMRHTIQWTRTTTHSATIEISVAGLAAWAIRGGPIRAVDALSPTAPTAAALGISLSRNHHLRQRLLQICTESYNVGECEISSAHIDDGVWRRALPLRYLLAMWSSRTRHRRIWVVAGVAAVVLMWAPAHLPSATAQDALPQPSSGTNPSDLYDKAQALDSDQPPEVALDGFASGRRGAGTNCQPLVPLDAVAPSDKFICVDISQLDQDISPQPVLPPGAPSRDSSSTPSTTLLAPIRPIPLWCELNEQVRKRFEQCTACALTVTIGSGSTVTGTSSQLVSDYSYTSNSDVAVNDQLQVSATTIVGTAAGISVRAEPFCLGCTGNAAGFTSGEFKRSSQHLVLAAILAR